MALSGFFLLLLLYVCLLINGVDAFTCSNKSEVFARVNETARFNYSVKGQIEGVATFEFIGPNGILGQFSYNSKSDYLSIQNGRDVRIDADWNGNIKVTKSHITSSDLGLYTLAKVGRESKECSFLFILDRPTIPNIISQYTTVGENGTLKCNSTSTTYPSNHSLGLIYNWWVNNDINVKRKFYTYSGNLLIITNLTERDARLRYTCIARENIANGYSSDVSDEFYFNITYGPDENTTLVMPPESLYTLDEGSVLEDIKCTGICFPLCYYQWVKKKHNSSTVFVNNSEVLSLGVTDRAEGAKYICTVSNPDSMRNVSKEVTVIVTYGPDHNTTSLSPNRTSYTLPEDTVLNNISCHCKCNPACEFIWMRVSDNRTIANGHVLSLGSLTRYNADTYVCIVTNPGKNGTDSRDIDITVIYGPDHNTTILFPSASTYIVNEDTILNDINCSGDCLPDCDYQWTKLEAIGVKIVGNQTGVLSLGIINRTATATYICTVSNPELNRTATQEVTIYVRYGPDENTTILSPSTKSYTVDEYSSLSPVTCKSKCYPDCVYMWTMIVSGERETVNNTGVLSLGSVQRNDAAIYVCTVTNPHMTHGIATRGITVHVRYGPDLPILNVQSPFIITEGDVSGDISCSASCYPACFNTWTNESNGINIGYDGTFTFGTVTRYQAGVYKCTSHNIDTKNSSQVTIHVVVNYAPDVSIRVSTTNFTEGANITLFCDAEGVPSNYTYTYFIQTWEGTEIHNDHSALTGAAKYSSIHIRSLKLRDSGKYICSVNNGIIGENGILNQNASTVIHVKVLPKVLKGDLIFFGSTHGLTVVVVPVYSDPVIDTASFKRNGSFVLPYDEKYDISYKKVPLNVMFYDKLVTLPGEEIRIAVINFSEDDFGNYTLALKNSLGQTVVTVVILPESEPFSPKAFTLQWRKNTPTVGWEKDMNGGHEQSFVIQTMKDGASKWFNYRIINESEDVFKTNETFYLTNVTNLKPGSYKVRIIARNIIGDSKPVYLNSPLTVDALKTETDGKGSEFTLKWPIIGAASGTFLIITVVSVTVAVMHKKRTRQKSEECTDLRTPYNTLEIPKENEYEEPASYASVTVYADTAKSTADRNAIYENVELKQMPHGQSFSYQNID